MDEGKVWCPACAKARELPGTLGVDERPVIAATKPQLLVFVDGREVADVALEDGGAGFDSGRVALAIEVLVTRPRGAATA